MGRNGRKSVLIVKFGAIGDVIMAIPAAHRLYEQGFDVHWAAGRAVEPLLRCYSWVYVIPVDDGAILRGSPGKRLVNVFRLWRETLGLRYDLCAILYYDRRYRILMFPVRAWRKIALSSTDRGARLLPGRHHTDEYVRMLTGAEDDCKEGSASPVRPDRLPPSPLPATRATRRIAIAPGGASNLLREQILRRWPIELYVALARTLLDRGWEVVLLGGPDDRWVQPYFEQLAVIDLVANLTLPEVVGACDRSDAVVTHDAGPLHLAGLSEASVIGIFGPVDPRMRIPRRPYAVGIWGGRGFACRPCYDGRDFAPCSFNGCMHQVRVENVLEELDRLLDARDRGLDMPWRVVEPGQGLARITGHRPERTEVLG